jgi:hypothetical protein
VCDKRSFAWIKGVLRGPHQGEEDDENGTGEKAGVVRVFSNTGSQGEGGHRKANKNIKEYSG